eukprot:UN29682
MFYADEFIKDPNIKYVGFVDTDTIFSTVVLPHHLFNMTKPHINAHVGAPLSEFWRYVTQSTSTMIEKDYIMKCMTYFPVIIKLDHIKNLRDYFELKFEMDFKHIFKKLIKESGGNYSQFDIICNWLWYSDHKTEYEWHFQMIRHSEEDVTGQEYMENIT